MAKSKHNRRPQTYQKRNIINPSLIAKPRLLHTIPTTINDNRQYQPPQKLKRAALLRKLAIIQPRRQPQTTKKGIYAFSSLPEVKSIRLETCQKRSIRQSVLHALKKTGSGTGRNPHKITWRSHIKC